MMKQYRRISFLPLLCGIMLVPCGGTHGQDILGNIMERVSAFHDEYEVDLSLLRKPTTEEWNQFWRLVDTALQAESMEDLAELLPYARAALAYLDQYPEAKPYADWLRHQMDYFEMADTIVHEQPAAVPPPPSRPPQSILPPPRKPAATRPPVPPPSAAPVSSDVDKWIKKLENRPAPKNAGTYVPLLKPVFARHGVPEALVWLAEVESSFNPEARSPVGALGMYQFMPATAERFGLQLKPRDQRLEPERSADAAARYLKFLHGKFQSWPLALAAYNAGEGRVGRLLSKHGGATFEDIAAHLPAETRMYVPKIDAVVRLREGSALAAL